MDLKLWEKFSKGFYKKDEEVSSSLKEKSNEHYAIKYNEFMAVKIENS
jgi:hypothetical protein